MGFVIYLFSSVGSNYLTHGIALLHLVFDKYSTVVFWRVLESLTSILVFDKYSSLWQVPWVSDEYPVLPYKMVTDGIFSSDGSNTYIYIHGLLRRYELGNNRSPDWCTVNTPAVH